MSPALSPVPAGAVVACRVRDGQLEVLMVKRVQSASFAPGAWAFPGGAVDALDRTANGDSAAGRAEAAARAALREWSEEVGVAIGGVENLQPLWRWITPEGLPRTFDAYFFGLHVADDWDAPALSPSPVEVDEVAWQRPIELLARQEERTVRLAFPTRVQLRQLSMVSPPAFPDFLASARAAFDVPVRPELDTTGDQLRVRLGADGAWERP